MKALSLILAASLCAYAQQPKPSDSGTLPIYDGDLSIPRWRSYWFPGTDAEQPKPFSVSGNFPRDLYGPIDTRMAGQTCGIGPCIWGHADSAVLPITFHPAAGYRVRILRLRGDLISWPKVLEGEPAIPENRYAGVLLGFSSTSSAGSVDCDFCAAGCFLYIQDALHGGEARRAPFDYDFSKEWVVLDSDGVLNLKLAAFLNTMGRSIHTEGTYTISAQFVK